MVNKFRFLLKIDKDGKVDMPLSNLYQKLLQTFQPDTNLQLIVQPIVNQRSLDQNAYYWGVVIPFVRSLYFESGTVLTDKQTHIEMRIMFLTEETASLITGEVLSLIGHTSELSTKQFAEYIENIAQFVAEMFYAVLPEPTKN